MEQNRFTFPRHYFGAILASTRGADLNGYHPSECVRYMGNLWTLPTWFC